MLKRSITGAFYVAVMVAFFLLRELLDARLFHIFTCFLVIAGTVEIVNALKNYLDKIKQEQLFKFEDLYYIAEEIIFEGIALSPKIGDVVINAVILTRINNKYSIVF